MTDERIRKGLGGCLAIVCITLLICLAFVAGYESGRQFAAAPVQRPDQAYLFEDEPVRPTPTPQETIEQEQPLKPLATPEAGQSSASDQPAAFDLYWDVWHLIERDFYGELPSEQEQIYGAIRGALQTLDDDYTTFIEADIAEINRSDMSGSFEGIGATVQLNDSNQVEIVRPLDNQPAETAGLRAGDIILAVDDTDLKGMGLYEAIALIRGPEGTTVRLSILRPSDGETFEIEIVRAQIPLPTIDSEMLAGDIGYIHLYEFNGQATERLQEALADLLAEQPAGIILDLRNNPGGFLNQAVSVADEFLPAGIVLYERGSGSLERVFESTDEGLADQIPLVVLINGGSASASEIVAGAIQDRGRGVLIGETSFGKGSVQQVHTLSDGSELRITIARWFTPNNRAIHGAGLEPDLAVAISEEDLAADRDPQLERALEYLRAGE